MSIKIGLLSLGCPRNLVDAEYMVGHLPPQDHAIVDDITHCDVAIVHTCGFIQDAKEESIDAILKLIDLKREGTITAIIVTGCLSQRFQDEFADELPEVDAFCGIECAEQLPQIIRDVLAGSKTRCFKPVDTFNEFSVPGARQVLDKNVFSYVKISEGCSHACTFCVIPQIKGPHRSRHIDEIIDEAKALVSERSSSEIVLIGQDISTYGMDRYGVIKLPGLLENLASQEVMNDRWLRLLYLNPEGVTDKLIDVMKRHKNICHYFDIPIEHASDKILRMMRRPLTRDKLIQTCARIRAAIPDAVFRTSVIVGFPGETDEDFNDLLDLLRQVRFERLGAFIYSAEDGTPAATFPEQIPEEVKQHRFDRVMQLQQDISAEILASWQGRILRVLVEDNACDANANAVGRSYADAPEVDGVVYLRGKDLIPGKFVDVKIIDSYEYDLVGDVI